MVKDIITTEFSQMYKFWEKFFWENHILKAIGKLLEIITSNSLYTISNVSLSRSWTYWNRNSQSISVHTCSKCWPSTSCFSESSAAVEGKKNKS